MRMRGMPFWARFFQLTLPERKEAARKLILASNLDENGRTKAFSAMEEFAAILAKDGDSYSDLYATFQEERHTAVSAEERNSFEPLYFKQEARAVERLLIMAKEALAANRPADALALIEGTQYSELRVRSAQKMKAQCLRQLGRNAEAELLDAETLATWPELATARRLFRFLAKFVNEAKRMVSGAGEKTKQSGGASANGNK